ncbi:MAG: hybrid sensor histidine kinase/response regulator [Desulfobulbaceae bacterium]
MTAKRTDSVLKDKVKHLERYVLEQNKMQDALKEILAATANRRGEDFFRTLVTQIARVLNVRYALISELLNHETARTIALWNGKALGRNMSYALAGTPCAKVIGQGFCMYPDNVQQKFPEDFQMVELGGVSYAGTPLIDTHGKPIGILAIIDDKPFTQGDLAEFLMSVFAIQAAAELFSMRVEKELRISRDEWESSFNAIEDIVTILDKDMRILRANSAAAAYLGVGVEYLVGKYCYEVFQGKACACDNCPEVMTLRDGQHHTGVVRHEHSGRIFLVSTSAIHDEFGDLKNIVHVARDITVQKELEEELYQARKMEAIGTLAGGIAHDFNNILTSVLGYAELLRDDIIKGRAATDKVDKVIKGALRARDLVRQILTFSRRTMQKPLPLKPHLIISESLKLLRSSLPATIEIRQNIDKEGRMIVADPTKLQQVLMNLCTNALQAMENQKGVLTVHLLDMELSCHDLLSDKNLKPGAYVELSVSDTGCGIEDTNLKRIFEPYFTTRGHGKGCGLGLSLVHGIVRDHNGLIKVESEVGKGSTFRVYFPAVREAAGRESKSPPEPVSAGTERILLVDDEEDVVDVQREGLTRLGYQVTISMDSGEAFQLFCANPHGFDLIITDQTMPNMTGVELARKILAIRQDIPVILCTGYSPMVDEEEALATGIRHFVIKPVELAKLTRLVRTTLDHPNPRQNSTAS